MQKTSELTPDEPIKSDERLFDTLDAKFGDWDYLMREYQRKMGPDTLEEREDYFKQCAKNPEYVEYKRKAAELERKWFEGEMKDYDFAVAIKKLHNCECVVSEYKGNSYTVHEDNTVERYTIKL